MTFVIDAENNITAYTDATAPDGAELKLSEQCFSTEKELAALVGVWPGARLIEIWNTLPGVTPVKKFTDRKKAVARIWKSIQSLVSAPDATSVKPPTTPTKKASKTTKATGAARAAKGAKDKPAQATRAKKDKNASTPRDGSKKGIILALLQQKDGTTLTEIMSATGWQAHSVRGFISGHLGTKLGLSVESTKNEAGERSYRLPK